ncbi:unnamed protein product [Arctia plantaginis]|uniref:Uncharacterized protein n=1 Tax=Arctia plantaginis TaxID=874455 RepID=A0A8S1A7Z7_ARCPL|nr:unnamed protein product [Arctia plantaginis]
MSGNMAVFSGERDVATPLARLTRHVTSRLKMAATPVASPLTLGAPVFQPDPIVLLGNNNLECSRQKGN